MKKPGGTATQKRPAAPVPASNKKPETLPETTEGFPWPSSHEIKKESNPFTDRDWRMLIYAWSGLLVARHGREHRDPGTPAKRSG